MGASAAGGAMSRADPELAHALGLAGPGPGPGSGPGASGSAASAAGGLPAAERAKLQSELAAARAALAEATAEVAEFGAERLQWHTRLGELEVDRALDAPARAAATADAEKKKRLASRALEGAQAAVNASTKRVAELEAALSAGNAGAAGSSSGAGPQVQVLGRATGRSAADVAAIAAAEAESLAGLDPALLFGDMGDGYGQGYGQAHGMLQGSGSGRSSFGGSSYMGNAGTAAGAGAGAGNSYSSFNSFTGGASGYGASSSTFGGSSSLGHGGGAGAATSASGFAGSSYNSFVGAARVMGAGPGPGPGGFSGSTTARPVTGTSYGLTAPLGGALGASNYGSTTIAAMALDAAPPAFDAELHGGVGRSSAATLAAAQGSPQSLHPAMTRTGPHADAGASGSAAAAAPAAGPLLSVDAMVDHSPDEGSGDSAVEALMREAAEANLRYFGHRGFRGQQRKVIAAALARRDGTWAG